MRRLRGSLVALGLLATLAGCGGGDEPAPSPGLGAGSSLTAAPTPTTESSAEQALTAGLGALLGVPAVDFRYRILSGETTLTETSGRAFLAGGWSATTTFDDAATGVVAPQDGEQRGGTDHTMSVRATDDDVFMQLSSWPEPAAAAGCG